MTEELPEVKMEFDNYVVRIYSKSKATLEWTGDPELQHTLVEIRTLALVGNDCVVTTEPAGNKLVLVRKPRDPNDPLGGHAITISSPKENARKKTNKRWKR